MSEVGGITSVFLPAKPGLEAASQSGAEGLFPGAVVDAELVELLSDTEGIWRIGARLVNAAHPEGLEQGARLKLQVVSKGPPLELKPVESPQNERTILYNAPARGLVSCITDLLSSSKEALPEIESSLLSSLASFLSFPEDPEKLGAALARWVMNCARPGGFQCGQPNETPNLKAILSALVEKLPDGKLSDSAEALLLHLGFHQTRSGIEGATLIPFVLPWGADWIQGEIRIEEESKKGSGKGRGPANLLIKVEMPRLGAVEARILLGEPGLSVRIALSPEHVEEAGSCLGELAQRLSASAGFRVADIKIEPLRPSILKKGSGLVEILI